MLIFITLQCIVNKQLYIYVYGYLYTLVITPWIIPRVATPAVQDSVDVTGRGGDLR